jgi:hypothetical protein
MYLSKGLRKTRKGSSNIDCVQISHSSRGLSAAARHFAQSGDGVDVDREDEMFQTRSGLLFHKKTWSSALGMLQSLCSFGCFVDSPENGLRRRCARMFVDFILRPQVSGWLYAILIMVETLESPESTMVGTDLSGHNGARVFSGSWETECYMLRVGTSLIQVGSS